MCVCLCRFIYPCFHRVTCDKFGWSLCMSTCVCVCMYPRDLGVIIEVPQVQMANSIHTSKEGRVNRRPHHVIHVVRVILERVERLIILQDTKKTAEEQSHWLVCAHTMLITTWMEPKSLFHCCYYSRCFLAFAETKLRLLFLEQNNHKTVSFLFYFGFIREKATHTVMPTLTATPSPVSASIGELV